MTRSVSDRDDDYSVLESRVPVHHQALTRSVMDGSHQRLVYYLLSLKYLSAEYDSCQGTTCCHSSIIDLLYRTRRHHIYHTLPPARRRRMHGIALLDFRMGDKGP